MGKFVAKRKLRNSYSQKIGHLNGLYSKNIVKKRLKSGNEISNFKQRFLTKLLIQCISVISIFILIVLVNVLDIKMLKNSKISDVLQNEFNKNYTLNEIKGYINLEANRIYSIISPVIPDSLSQKTVAVFSNVLDNIKKYGTNEIEIYKEVEIYQERNHSLDLIKLETLNASVFDDESVIRTINACLAFENPTVGIVTSNYGEREEIFKGNGTFHSGVDIANEKGTKIISSIDGKVKICNENVAFGKYVEVENGDILTRYCHLDKITIKEGEYVNKGEKIGEMGMTGQATGYHLHFEIWYEGKSIDPQKLLSLE